MAKSGSPSPDLPCGRDRGDEPEHADFLHVGDFIRSQRELARLSIRRLAELAEVSNPYLSQIERGLRKPSAEILQSIAKGLRISAETHYVRAGILDERAETTDLVTEIEHDTTISERHKRALIDIYHSFQSERATEVATAQAREAG